MISIDGLEYLKAVAELQAELIPGGILYTIIEGDIATWQKASSTFNHQVINLGEKIRTESVAAKAIKEKKTLIEKIPRSVYGTRLNSIAVPLVKDEEIVGAFSMLFPRLHPVIQSFDNFAPIVSEMFAEGATIFTTDLHKILKKQASKKFDIEQLKVNDILEEDSIASRVIRSRKPIIEEIDGSKFGVNVLEACYPLYDEDDTEQIVATFCIITPKEVAANLRNMSSNLEDNLSGIASAIEELAASASQIHANEIDLNKNVNEITTLSEEINEVSLFIKEIADETKMLGLNAAIEAARAGEYGKGFGVVAEEIRKLSEQSKSTVPKIKKLTDNIKNKVDEVSEKSQNSLAASQEQASGTEEITASIEEITSATEELNKIARTL